MTKLRRSGSMDFGTPNMSNVLDVAKAICLACKTRSKPKRSFSLFQVKSCPPAEVLYAVRRPQSQYLPRPMEGAVEAGRASAATRSVSVNSVSSESSTDHHLVEQEDIIALTHDVRSFKEALGKLRRIFHPEREKLEQSLRHCSHERLGEVLRILRSMLEKYPPIQNTELLMAAGTLIHQVKGYNYENEKADPSSFFDAIDQLALSFSSRVSEYLMGDLDNSTQPVPKTRSCDNLLSADGECDPFIRDKRSVITLPPEEIDARLGQLSDGVDLALRRAKVWSKYAKDVMTYIEKRCCAEAEHAKNLVKLAQTMRPILKEESFLPFQSIYYMALDQDFDNGQTSLKTCAVLQGHKFIEPLTARRNEHEKLRKQVKETWQRELKRTHESISNLRKAKHLYFQRQQEYEKAKESALRAESCEGAEASSKVDKKRRVEEDSLQRAMEAETTYKACILEANERQLSLHKMKSEVLQQVRELIYQCDQTMKAVTVGYFQLQSTLSAHAPVQFQTLCESSRLYEPGTQYMEFVKRLPTPSNPVSNGTMQFTFESYSSDNRLDKSRKSNGSNDSSEDILNHGLLESRLSSDSRDKLKMHAPLKAWGSTVHPINGSDSDSISCQSQDNSPAPSPTLTRKITHTSSCDELETDQDTGDSLQNRRTCMSKAAQTHEFRRLKTPSKCRECDSYVYFHGVECSECGLASHKKCLESLAIQCGRKRLPRKMNTFGVDLLTHAQEFGDVLPYIVTKCVAEVEEKGVDLKGIYRVSGVKSRVEKLCQSFENGAELVDLEGIHPNIVSNVLKLYLRQLPEPLLTYRLYPDFIRIAKEYPGRCEEKNGEVIEELRKLVQRLPAIHFVTLKYLMHHLHRMSENSSVNNMPPSNMGIVFGPTLLRTSEGSASLSCLIDTVHQTRVIELLITHVYKIFGPPSKSPSSHKDEPSKHKAKTPRSRVKESLHRTVSGSSQVSDAEEFPEVDHNHRDGIADLEDYTIPGLLPPEKTPDAIHSAEDLYSTLISDEDITDILLTEDPLRKPPPDKTLLLKPLRPSLSSSPAVSEASHCSLRSTDDEGGVEGAFPVPPPRKHQNCCKAASESSGVSSAASTSPTGTLDDSVYTSTASVTLGGHNKSPGGRTSTSELRRQFFELPKSALEGMEASTSDTLDSRRDESISFTQDARSRGPSLSQSDALFSAAFNSEEKSSFVSDVSTHHLLHATDSLDNGHAYLCSRLERSSDETRTELYTVKHVQQPLFEAVGRTHFEGPPRGTDKLSPNRQPRFV